MRFETFVQQCGASDIDFALYIPPRLIFLVRQEQQSIFFNIYPLQLNRSPFLLLKTSAASYLLFSRILCSGVAGACPTGATSSLASLLGLPAWSNSLMSDVADISEGLAFDLEADDPLGDFGILADASS